MRRSLPTGVPYLCALWDFVIEKREPACPELMADSYKVTARNIDTQKPLQSHFGLILNQRNCSFNHGSRI